MRKKRIGKRRQDPKSAQGADRYRLYEKAVQDPDAEVLFLEEKFFKARHRLPRTLREDFCGTAQVACRWVESRRTRRAVGVDCDAEVLEWARKNNLARLNTTQRRRIRLVQDDVLRAMVGPHDLVIAMNFSYWVFKNRETLRRYFRRVRQSLAPDGLFLLDAYGGYEAYQILREQRDMTAFTYIWDQADFDPITHATTCHIHFKFPDGSRINRAFSYEWRLWTLPEIREILSEAGFGKTTVLWQGIDDETGEGNGDFQPVDQGAPDAAWIAYIQAEL